MTIITFFVVLFALVVVHEFGHFLFAKLSGMRVDEFAFGFPPRLFSKKKGETLYSFNLIPLGGYVKIAGETPGENAVLDGRNFFEKNRGKQALVVFAGILFNLVFAWVLFSVTFFWGTNVIQSEIPSGAVVKSVSLTVLGVKPDSPAERAGITPGDKIIEFTAGGDKITEDKGAEAVTNFVRSHGDSSVVVSFRKPDGQILNKEIRAESSVGEDTTKYVGLYLENVAVIKMPFFRSLAEGAKLTYEDSKLIAGAIYGFLRDAFSGQGGLDKLTGPVGLVSVVGKAEAIGFSSLLNLAALISINLALFNFLPLPALDGGRLLFIGIEAVTRRSISAKFYMYWNAVGMILLLLLAGIVTYHDIARIW